MKYLITFIVAISIAASVFSNENLEGHVGLAYPDTESIEFLTKVLESLDKKYKIKNINGKKTIFWKPENTAQENEVSARVSQFNFIKTACPNLPIPDPSEPSKSDLSC